MTTKTTTKTTKRERYLKSLEGLLAAPQQLEAYLLQGSALPGRRANLELAAALADGLAGAAPAPALRAALDSWATTSPDAAPTNTAREFLPFCAVQALGACYLDVDAGDRERIVARIRAAARDGRWRMREAACFALQRLGERDLSELLRLLEAWRPDASPLDLRAMLVALAHGPLLERPAAVDLALELTEVSLRLLEGLADSGDAYNDNDDGDGAKGQREEVRVLEKGLAFAPSVFTAADPERGFALLRRWAGCERLAIKKLVAANLRKARLARAFPDEVQAVGELLSAD